MPTVRVEQCTHSFHKTAQTDISLAQATGSAHDSIPGRHPSIGIFPRGGEGTCGANHRDTVTTGLCDQQGESQLEPTQKIQFLGFWVDSRSMTISFPEEKVEKIKKETRVK